MDLAGVIDELYGLPLDAFIPTRDERVKAARAAKDRDLAQSIAALRKPSAAAWTLNIAAREAPDEIDAVLSLGEAIRSAQSGGGAVLRGLLGARQAVVAAALAKTRELADARDHAMSESVATEVEQTLRAAMGEPEVAEVVRLGRLTSAVTTSVLAGLDLGSVSVIAGTADAATASTTTEPVETPEAQTPAATKAKAKVRTKPDARVAAAQRELDDATAAIATLERSLTEARRTAERADGDVQQAQDEVKRLRSQVRDAEAALAAAEKARNQAASAVEDADLALSDGEADADAARRHLVELQRAGRED